MKKILIVSHAMEIGGAERALLGLLESIDYTSYEVDLFLFQHHGELMSFIPDKVTLLPEMGAYSALNVPIMCALKKGHPEVAVGRTVGKFLAKRTVKKQGYKNNYEVRIEYSHKYTYHLLPNISSKRYDVAISFLTPHYVVAHKVSANKRIAWIHTDYGTIQVDRKSELRMWNQYEKIVSISAAVTENFIRTFPELKNRIVEIGNIMPVESIKLQAAYEGGLNCNDSVLKLLSIGRFCHPKNFDSIPAICKKILECGKNIKWYLIGFGIDEELIRKKIIDAGMQEYVIILGKKENPYPYIKACDIYVQPSRYEGKCVSVIEAQILRKPVIITNYTTASSQLEDGVDGVIVPLDNEGCAAGIIKVIENDELRCSLVHNMENRDYSNKTEIKKLYSLF